jgi:hypothetical protein
MKKLNIYELHDEINKKKEKRSRSFDKVLEICHQKVINASKKELVKVFFDVPEFVIGLPVYDLSECIRYIVKSLEENGFLVQYFFPKLLYISWDFNEINGKDQINKRIPFDNKPHTYIQNNNANKLIMKPSTSKQLEHRPNGKFVLNID